MADCGPEPNPTQILVNSHHVLPRHTISLEGDRVLLTHKCLGTDESLDRNTDSQESQIQCLPGLVDPKPEESFLMTGPSQSYPANFSEIQALLSLARHRQKASTVFL